MDPSKWLVDHESGYAALPAGDRKAMRDFALLWSLLEYRLFGTRANSGTIAAAMATLGNRIQPSRLGRPLRYFADRYIDQGAGNARFEALNFANAADRMAALDVLRGTETAPVKVATGLLLIVYRLRNNFFHGPKWAYDVVGQRANFRHASMIMMTVMEF